MRKAFLFILTVIIVTTSTAQRISYVVSFPNMVHHEANISVVVSGLLQKNAIFRMSRSSPGRYATHEFGKNIYDVKAFDKTGKAITINRIDGDIYEVPRHDGYVRVDYILYANHPDGTYAGIDGSSIHLNMPATFLWIKGLDQTPIDIKFNIPDNKKWTVATQLKPTNDATLFTAPGLQYFMDCPTKIGNLVWKEWSLTNTGGKTYRFRLALEAKTTDSLATAFANNIKRITQEAQQVFGELPDYDYGTYTFIASINPYVKGDGMEHRNSTMISLPAEFTGENWMLEVFSHEFFHCWNVERIRPKTIEPFNFEKSNMSSELWCAEGFTQYYGDLLVTRGGLETQEEFLQNMSALINTKENTAGAKRYSPVEMSRHAVFVDAGVAIDKNNYVNMYSSYYPYGGAVALALDLELRAQFKLTLDDYMKALWKKFGKPETPYTVPGLQDALAQLTNKIFAENFFKMYVTGHEPLNYKPLLAKAGLLLKTANAGKPWMSVQFREGTTVISSNTTIGTPAYQAGLDIDDQITQLDGKPVSKQTDVTDLLKNHKPGDKLTVEYKHRGETMTTTITLGENPAYTVSTYEKENMAISDEMIAFREAWLGSKLK